MTCLQPATTYRTAKAEDAGEIAKLFLLSSDGLAEYIWSKVDPGSTDILSTGAKRYARENADFGYRNCILAETDGAVAGMLHGFAMPVTTSEPDSDPVLRPYSELEAPGSYYIAGIAVHDRFRRKGIGQKLMALAEKRAHELMLPTVSLICFTANKPAMTLYSGLGYKETDRRAIVPVPCLKYQSGDAALLVKDLG